MCRRKRRCQQREADDKRAIAQSWEHEGKGQVKESGKKLRAAIRRSQYLPHTWIAKNPA